jgi:hypothetical protein
MRGLSDSEIESSRAFPQRLKPGFVNELGGVAEANALSKQF